MTGRQFQRATLVLCLSAFVVILVATRWGPGLSDDSYSYLRPVREALAGKPLALSPQFPPLLPIVLLPFGVVGLDPVEGIRLLNAALFSTSAYLLALYIFEITGSRTFSVLGVGFLLVSAPMIQAYSRALSEPLYIALTLLAGLCLGRFLREGSRLMLLAAGISGGLSFATRYVGAATVLALIATVLVGLDDRWTRKVGNALMVATAGLLPMSIYMARNIAEVASPTGHGRFLLTWAFQPPSNAGLYNFLTWFIPGRFVRGREVEALVACALGVIVASVIVGATHKRAFADGGKALLSDPLVRFLLFFIGANLVGLMLARGFALMGDTFNERYIAPMYPALLVLVASVLATTWRLGSRTARMLVGLACALLGALLGYRGVGAVAHSYQIGDGYSGRRWHESETLAYMMRRPGTSFAATAPVGFYFWTGERPAGMPSSEGLDEFKRNLCDSGSLLVIVNELPPEFYGIETEDLVRGLTLVRDFSEGSIWACYQ